MRRSVPVGRRGRSLCHYRLCGLLHLSRHVKTGHACWDPTQVALEPGPPESPLFTMACRTNISDSRKSVDDTTMSSPPVVTENAPQRIDFSCSRQTLQVNRHSAPEGTCWSIDRSCFGIRPSGKALFCRVDGWVRRNWSSVRKGRGTCVDLGVERAGKLNSVALRAHVLTGQVLPRVESTIACQTRSLTTSSAWPTKALGFTFWT